MEKMDVDTEFKEEGKISRHCAFCLILIPLAEGAVRKCGKCLRRAYCGEECQKKDWKAKKSSTSDAVVHSDGKGSQGHKDWCGVPVDEEDLDWYRKEGGKGVVAKRLILKGERILVGHITPVKLFNHSCNANSSVYGHKEVSINIAVKDIEPGSEITFNYVAFNGSIPPSFVTMNDGSLMRIESFEDSRNALKSKYGITCAEDCICYDKEVEKIINKRQEVLVDLDMCRLELEDVTTKFMASVQDVIFDFDVVSVNPMEKVRIICILLDVLRRAWNREFAELIPNYEEEADDICHAIFPPNSKYSTLEGWKSFFLG